MKRLILILAMFGLPTLVHANMTGQELHWQLSVPLDGMPWVIGHAEGYIDGVISAALGCPSGKHLTSGQAWQIVQNYLEAHPEEWHKEAALLIKEALDPLCKY